MHVIIQRHLEGGVIEGGDFGQDSFQLRPWQLPGPVSIEKDSRFQRLGIRTRASPGRTAVLVRMRSGDTIPVTAKPYLGSSSSTENGHDIPGEIQSVF
jgi:hypothetical protein